MDRQSKPHERHRSSVAHLLFGAGALGACVGIGSVLATAQGRAEVAALVQNFGGERDVARHRPLQTGANLQRTSETAAVVPVIDAVAELDRDQPSPTDRRLQGSVGISAAAGDIGVASGLVRRRAPQTGDHWGGCNDARAAGTAPIYRGEPGYRTQMDGDDDGIACEPIPD